MRRRYVRVVQRLVDKGVLAWSSGSLPHLVEVADDGHIQRWPIVEGSLTPTPAEPRLTNVGTVKSAYKALGLEYNEPPSRQVHQEEQEDERGDDNMNENETTLEREGTARKRLPVASEREATKGITVGSQYDNLDALDLLHGYVLMRATKNFHGVSEQYANALAWKVQKAGITGIKSNELSS